MLDFQAKMRAFLEKNIDWLGIVNDRTSATEGAEKKMLDYACGDGFLTRVSRIGVTCIILIYIMPRTQNRKYAAKLTIPQVYHPFFTKCIGIDIAAGMVKKYNEAAIELGLASEKMYAVKGDFSASVLELPKAEDVASTDLSRDEFFNFDFVGVALALHHMEDPETAIVKMVERLKSGGVFLAIDLLNSEGVSESKDEEGNGGNHHHHHQGGHSHGHGHGHSHGTTATGRSGPAGHTISHDHPAFSIELVKDMFDRAGLTDVDIIYSDWKLELPFVTDPGAKLLVARGRKQ